MKSPLLGYNTNVRHHGKTFHIQTEDSGVGHGHIFTHLFADGGRIVATKKTTYAEWIGTDRYPTVVKKLMQAQHKAMFIALRDGLFDTDEIEGAKAFAELRIVVEGENAVAIPSAGMTKAAENKAEKAPPKAEKPAAPAAEVAPAKENKEEAKPSLAPPVLVSAPKSGQVDIEALERAAAALSAQAPSLAHTRVEPAPKSQPSPPSLTSLFSAPTPSAIYQQTQPVESRPRVPKQNESLFGADILSEKSLDEVIMSYLAEDLEEKE